MRKSAIIAAFVVAGLAGYAFAQTAPEQLSTTIEGKTIAVKHSPQSLKGQKIFGFHTEADLVFKGATVPKGDYTLYIIGDTGNWKLAISKQTAAKAGVYDAKLDVGRVPMTVTKSPAAVEACKLKLTKTAALAAKIEVAWENTVATVPFHLDRVAGDSEW